MNLSIREMLVGHPVRLRYVYRFSTSRVQHPETVAEHSYYVCFYCLMIGRWCNAATDSAIPPVNLERLMTRAVLHDLEEARSGDFPRPFKHSNRDLHTMLETASAQAMAQVLGTVLVGQEPAKELLMEWVNSKDNSREGRVLEFADFLSVLSFLYEECGNGGNRSIMTHVGEMHKYWDKFQGEDYDFIRPLVEQTRSLMEEVFHG